MKNETVIKRDNQAIDTKVTSKASIKLICFCLLPAMLALTTWYFGGPPVWLGLGCASLTILVLSRFEAINAPHCDDRDTTLPNPD